MGSILIQIMVILAVVGVLALFAYDDARTRKLREAEEDESKRPPEG